MRKSVSFGVLGALVALVAGFGAWAWVLDDGGMPGARVVGGVRVLKLAHGLEDTHPVNKALVFMNKRMVELSGGKLRMDLYPNAVMGGEIETLEQVQAGQLAMTKVSTAALEEHFPEARVFGIPYLFRDEAHFWKVLNGPIGEEILEKGRPKGFFGLCYYDAGARSFYATKKQVRSVADVDGLKVRVMSSRTALDMIEAMKGSPCPTVWGELYTALQQGTVDAAENNPPSFVSSRHYEVAPFFALTEHQRLPDVLVFSTKGWELLSEQERAWVRQAAVESQAEERRLWAEDEAKAMVFLREKGVEILEEPDRESFRKACAGVIDLPQYANIKALYDAIQEVK